jgi:NTE family protein
MRLGLVIGSGGIKPVAAIPVLAMLESMNVGVCKFAGCSGGAVVASMGAFGFPAAEMERLTLNQLTRNLFAELNWAGLLSVLRSGRHRRQFALLKPHAIAGMFTDVFGTATVDRLSVPLALQATDRATGDGVVLRRGGLAQALLASIAAPPLLPPVEIDGRMLIDGALSAPVPLDAVAGNGVDRVISIGTSVQGAGPSRVSDDGSDARLGSAEKGGGPNALHIEIPFKQSIRWWDTQLVPALLEHGREIASKARCPLERFLAGPSGQ